VYERIRTIGPGGGYMVASSNSIADYVPLDNMKAMFDATYEFGSYPLRLEEGKIKGKIWTFQGKPQKEKIEIEADLNINRYLTAMLGNDVDGLVSLTQNDIRNGLNVSEVVNKGMIPAMTVVGERFQTGEIYIPEMMMAAKTMSEVLEHFKDQLTGRQAEKRGTVVVGTVKGDLHDIGKNLVSMMLDGQGFEVEDIGLSVTTEEFIAAVQEKKPDILALSALLTTTMVEMKKTIDGLREAGLRQKVKVIVGGAPLTQAFANEIGADGYAYDAPGAAKKCSELLSG
jgi:5-methyltetrahydrofolate--homocysteine methyltransferase